MTDDEYLALDELLTRLAYAITAAHENDKQEVYHQLHQFDIKRDEFFGHYKPQARERT